MSLKKQDFHFHTKGETMVFVDWANVYAWSKKTKWVVETKKLFTYFSSKNIIRKTLFFGTDTHIKSQEFLENCKEEGWEVITKPVKYIKKQRKCDFDVEISVETILSLEQFETIIIFSGDGDYAYLVEKIMQKGKRVFIVGADKCMGKEWFEMRKEKLHPILVDIQRLKKHLE